MAEDKTVYVNTDRGSGAGAGLIVAVVLLVALIIGVVFFSRLTGSETSKNNAVANAAHQVDNAASQSGNAAAQNAANNTANK